MKKGLSGVLNMSTMVLAVLLSSSSAFAVNVNGSVGATSVPSLSGSMLVVLSLLLFAVALRISKQNKAVNKLMITLLGVGVIVSAGSGIKLISEVKAGVPTVTLSGNTSFGSPGSPSNYASFLDNNTGQPVTITFTPDVAPTASRCSLQKSLLKPVKSLSKQAKLAAAPIPQPCGDAITTNFNPGGTYTVTLNPGEFCYIECSSAVAVAF